ncbi:unnamed protein product, partial [Discosporangium mesarthrocarpum]
EGGEGGSGHIVLALDVLGSFEFYTIPSGPDDKPELAREYRLEMLRRAMQLMRTHALRCLDDADDRVRASACAACCRLLSRAAPDASASASGDRGGGGGGGGGSGAGSLAGAGLGPGEGKVSGGTTVAVMSMGPSPATSPRSDSNPIGGGGVVGLAQGNRRASWTVGRSMTFGAGPSSVGDSARGGGVVGGGDREAGFKAEDWVKWACVEVLERVLTVGLADESPLVRRAVIGGLEADRALDPLVALSGSMRSLFEAINDEVFEVSTPPYP